MYDLHMHTLLSDGEMLPVELIRRCAVLGYTTIAITDHVDASNLEAVIHGVSAVRDSARYYGVELLCGVELTHVPPPDISLLASRARDLGADIVIVHGETVMEPVAPGTNREACGCIDVDVLAHPGLISRADADLAAEHNVSLEITARAGHNRTNGHVLSVAREAGNRVTVNSDAHAPSDIMTAGARNSVARGAGMTESECNGALSFDRGWLR